jgi:hypothetical protein
VESLWDLFHTAGYFNLSGKSPEEFDRLRAQFVEVGQKGACVPGLFCHAVVPSDRGVEATVSILKAYESTWMLHQLAKRPRQPGAPGSRQILRDLYVRAFEHTQTDRKLKWALAYAEATVPWNQQTHFAFAQKHAETRLAMAMPFQLMEVRSADRSVSGDSGFEIGFAREDEVRTILAVVAATRPRPYTEALDLVDERVDLGGAASHWRREGLSREREILVARRGGVAVAAAIVESGETGTNLFRLLDGLRLIPLLLGGSAALPALLDAARAWFGARGKESFVYFREGEDPGPASITRLGDLGEGKLWIVAAEILPEFLEHVFEITSPRR